uniref:Putative RNA-dependent RNA polymerase n=1 Tax=Rhizoctonia solani mitovirus 29 TaxID=2599420 RepID=A0A5B8GTB3_9VIRU|nr:putative RNA-dependent RNA polymerase [Rhizoctonia solani mitovirus 29]
MVKTTLKLNNAIKTMIENNSQTNNNNLISDQENYNIELEQLLKDTALGIANNNSSSEDNVTNINSRKELTSYGHKSTQKDGSLIITNDSLPKLNVKRNQSRLVNAIRAIMSYMNNSKLFDSSARVPIAKLLSIQEVQYSLNPSTFVKDQKLLANWLKVNVTKTLRTQDQIPNEMWNRVLCAPNVLTDVLLQYNKQTTTLAKYMYLRLIISCLELYNVVLVPTRPSLETITEDYTGRAVLKNIINIEECVESLGIDIESLPIELANQYANTEYHMSSAAGPNGQSLWTSHIDAKAIVEHETLSINMTRFATLVNKTDLINKLDESTFLPMFFKQSQPNALVSKLSFIFEKGNKTRVIAILDWWTQEILNPLHNVIAELLRGIKMDGTFDQDRIAEQVREWTKDSNSQLHSLDLTAATDRLPVLLQEYILDYLFKIEGFGEAWRLLLTDREFMLPNGEFIRYAVGQPMGAKTSFPMLAFTHHLIVQQAALNVSIKGFKDYVILGDDIVINSKVVADSYMELMDALGMAIVKTKSIIASNVPNTSTFSNESKPVAEICRRLFISGLEITGLPLKLIANVMENNDMAYQLQEELNKRGFVLSDHLLALFLASILQKRGFQKLAMLNGLPKQMTGITKPFSLISLPEFNHLNWKSVHGIEPSSVIEFFKFTLLVEQLKKIGSLLNSTASTYDTMMKAANLVKAEILSFKNAETSNVTHVLMDNFSPLMLEEGKLTNTFHPAKAVIKQEVARIDQILMQLTTADEEELINLLLSNVVDSIRISATDIITQNDFTDSILVRTLVDKTISNIFRAKSIENQMLSFSMKLSTVNVVWNLAIKFNGQLLISKSNVKAVTTIAASEARLRSMSDTTLIKELFR